MKATKIKAHILRLPGLPKLRKIQSVGNALGKAASSLKNTLTPTKGHANYGNLNPMEDYGGALKHGVEGMGTKAKEEVIERNAVKEAADDSFAKVAGSSQTMSGEKHPSSSILEKVSSTIHSAEEGVVHTFQGVAEGIKHSTSQILHGSSEEAGSFAKGIREANESIPRNHQEGHLPGAMTGESHLKTHETAYEAGEKIGEAREMAGSAMEDVKAKVRAAQSMVEEQVRPVSEAVQEKGMFQSIGDSISEKAHSIADRTKELLGEVSKEAGHVTGAIKSNDPEQKLPGRSGVGVAGRSFEESIQREYEAGQQEQFDPKRKTLADAASEKLGSAKEEAVNVAKGTAHKYGEVAEDIQSKIQEGREYSRRSSQN